jgi:hypothetical protein
VQYRCDTYAASPRGLRQLVTSPAAAVALARANAQAATRCRQRPPPRCSHAIAQASDGLRCRTKAQGDRALAPSRQQAGPAPTVRSQLGESDRGPGVDAGSHGARPATALGVATTRARDHEPDAICRLLHGRRHVDRRRERRRPRAPCPWRLRGSGTAPCRRDGPAARRYGVLAGAGPCCFGCPLERVRLRLAPRVSRPFQSAVPIGRADTPASDGSLAWRAERRPVERRAGAPRRSVRSGALAQRMWVSTLC